MTMILTKNIKEYCAERKAAIKEEIERDFPDKKPTLAVFQIGNVEASTRYIRNKKKDCEEVGINFEWYYYPEEITTEELVQEIKDMNDFVDGLIVQMPLPDHIDGTAIKLAIDPTKDVDGFHPMSWFDPCTPSGIINYLIFGCDFNFEGKNVTIFGRSDIVGKPLAEMLTNRDATVTLCHSKSKKDKWQYIQNADLVITAVGKVAFLNCYSIYTPVIDVGINFDENGKLVGDCINTENRDVTPVPGGVGLLTRVALLENTLLAAQLYRNGYRRNPDGTTYNMRDDYPCNSADGQCALDCKKFAECALNGTEKPE
jgi:methylenetetrahydrofolate dehydrogenase (NADP+)/methenyltetrahydrofolate cyclohydrolase